MKKMRRLIPAIAMLLVSAVMLSTASFAWFTMSNQADVTDMSVKAVASSSLLITNAKDGVEFTDFNTANGTIGLEAAPQAMYPAMHTSNGALQYLTNTSYVDAATGFIPAGLKDAEGNDIVAEYRAATEVTDSAAGYYYDYKVAIASAGAVTEGNLNAYVSTEVVKYIHNAVSIAFFVDASYADEEVTSEYTGKLINFAEVMEADGTLKVELGEITVPMAFDAESGADGDYIVVTMRVFFDGTLSVTGADNIDRAYVRNANMTTTDIGFDISFKVE